MLQRGLIKYRTPLTILLSLLVFVSIWFGQRIYLTQEPQGYYTKSNITVNLLLFYAMWGLVADKLEKTRGWSKRKGWALFIVGLIIMTLFFKYVGGYKTIF